MSRGRAEHGNHAIGEPFAAGVDRRLVERLGMLLDEPRVEQQLAPLVEVLSA